MHDRHEEAATLMGVDWSDPARVAARPSTQARRLRDALEAIAMHGQRSRAVPDRLAEFGLDAFESYVWSRAAALGTPTTSVVVSAFGVFEPGHLSAAYERARSKVSRDRVLAAREDGATAGLAAVLTAGDVAPLADALLDAMHPLPGTARPLFSGLRQLQVPTDPHGRLWRAADLVREHRGDGHLAAGIAAGLDPVAMNVLTELWAGYSCGEYTATRGFGQEAISACVAELTHRGWASGGRLTREGAAVRRAVEDATDASQNALIARLGDRLDGLARTAEALSGRLLAALPVPTDPRKLAAG
jgi:hypothetical protein